MKRLLLSLLAALALPTALESKFYTVDTDLMTDETKIRFYIESETQIQDSIGGRATPPPPSTPRRATDDDDASFSSFGYKRRSSF